MSELYWRPIVQSDAARRADAIQIGQGLAWCTHFEVLSRSERPETVPFKEAPETIVEAISAARQPVCGLAMDAPKIMGILNITPDSFSDGGKFLDTKPAVERALKMVSDGADILDIGGESTRPGADFVTIENELFRVLPVIEELGVEGQAPISIDTRKAEVARRAIEAGAHMFNDVSALSFDRESLATAVEAKVPVCLMHASGDPKTMQDRLDYSNVLLDVFDYLEARRDVAVAAGLAQSNIILDPGIGFGKTAAQNIELIRGISLFHSLGCPLLIGASRKRFIGEISRTEKAQDRLAGSLAVALEAARQGAQILRVHDVRETRQALDVWCSLHA